MNFSTPKFSMKEKDKYERNDINTTTLTFNGTTSTVNRIDDLDSKTKNLTWWQVLKTKDERRYQSMEVQTSNEMQAEFPMLGLL